MAQNQSTLHMLWPLHYVAHLMPLLLETRKDHKQVKYNRLYARVKHDPEVTGV